MPAGGIGERAPWIATQEAFGATVGRPLVTGFCSQIRFADIYQQDFGYVWQSLWRLGIRAADLEDRAHDVFVVVYRRLSDFDVTRPMRPWFAPGCMSTRNHGFRVPSDGTNRTNQRDETAGRTGESAQKTAPHLYLPKSLQRFRIPPGSLSYARSPRFGGSTAPRAAGV